MGMSSRVEWGSLCRAGLVSWLNWLRHTMSVSQLCTDRRQLQCSYMLAYVCVGECVCVCMCVGEWFVCVQRSCYIL